MDKFIKRKVTNDVCESKDEHSLKPINCSTKKTKVRHNRSYCDNYLKFSFTCSGDIVQQSPLCVVRGENISGESWYQVCKEDISLLNICICTIKILT